MASPQDYTPSDLLQNPNVRRYLDMIALAEGTNTHGYNTMFGGGRLPSLSDHPRQTMPFTQTDGVNNRTSAAGRYQFLESTWDDQAKKLNLTNFSPINQDLAAINILKETGALPHILKGEWEPALNKTGTIWAGLPTSPYKQPRQSREFVMSALNNESPSAVPERSIEDIQRAYEKAKAAGATASVERIGNLLNARYESAIQKATEAGRPDAVERIKATRDRIIGAGAVTPQAAQEPAVGAEATLGTPQQDGQPPEPSERDMGGIPPTSQPAPMYAGTTSSFTTPVETQGGAVLTTRRKGIAGGKQVMPEDSLGMTLANAVDPFVRGVADTLTFGYADELAAKADSALGINTADPTKPFLMKQTEQQALDAQRARDEQGGVPRIVGQVGGALIPTGSVIRGIDSLNRLGRAGYGALSGGTQGFLYGTGSSTGTSWGERAEDGLPGALWGAGLGGGLGALLPGTKGQNIYSFKKGAGSEEAARRKAEATIDFKEVANNPNLTRKVADGEADIATALRNERAGKPLNDLKLALERVEPDVLKKVDVESVLNATKTVTPTELEKIRGTTAGDALADAIEKYQYTRALTAPTEASNNILAKGLRLGIEKTPALALSAAGYSAAGPVGLLAGLAGMGNQNLAGWAQRLTGKASIPQSIRKLSSDKNVRIAQDVLDELGPSTPSTGVTNFMDKARKLEQTQAAKAAVAPMEQQAAATVERELLNKTLQDQAALSQGLGGRGSPISGAYTNFLEFTGLNNNQAIPILRKLSKESSDTELGIAAKQLLKSEDVANKDGYFALQNFIRDNKGALGIEPGALSNVGQVRSPVVNPISYGATVRNAEGALKNAVDNAPNNGLAQFATTVAATKNPAEKAALVEQRLIQATDPAEIKYLTEMVQPLTQFGSKAKKAAEVSEGALSTVTKSEKPVVAPKTKAQKPKAEPKGEKVDIKEPPALTKATKETSQTLPEDVQERLKRENEASLKAIFPGGVPDWFKPGPF